MIVASLLAVAINLRAAIPPRPCCVVFAVDPEKAEVTVAQTGTGALLKFPVPRRTLASIKAGDPVNTHDDFRRGVKARFFFWNGSGLEVRSLLRDVIIAPPFCCTATTDPLLSGVLTIRSGNTSYDAIVLAGGSPSINGARTAVDFKKRRAFIKMKGLTLAADLLPPVIDAAPSRPFRVVAPLKSAAWEGMGMVYSDMKRVLLLKMREEARDKKADAVTDVTCEVIAHPTGSQSPLTCRGNAILWTDAR